MENNFVNPYNFVSLSDSKISRSRFIEDDKSCLTGYIDITLTVENRIIIPGALKNGKYDYYHYSSSIEPVIPGSQVRGVVRSAYEVLTNSCLSSIQKDNDKLLVKRYNVDRDSDKVIKPFILEYNYSLKKWDLYNAEEEKITDIDYKNKEVIENRQLSLKLDDNEYSNFESVEKIMIPTVKNDEQIKYHLKKSNNNNIFLRIGKKKAKSFNTISLFKKCGLFVKNNCNEFDEAIKNFEIYLRKSKNYKDLLYKYNNKERMCVYAFEFKNRLYISPAKVGRIIPYESLDNLYKNYEPCELLRDKKNSYICCPSCYLFGFTSPRRNNSHTGKLKFLDLQLKSNFDVNKNTIVEELITLGPKISNFNFYGTGNETFSWDDNAKIRGRKFYWHSQNFNYSRSLVENPKIKSNNVISKYTALKNSDNNKLVFEGKVYFDEITKKELKYLIFALSLGNDKIHLHKIGHAKPLSYGSVKINCEMLHFRESSNSNYLIKYYEHKVDNDFMMTWDELSKNKQINEFKNITDINAVHDVSVRYPTINYFRYNVTELANDINDIVLNKKYYTENINTQDRRKHYGK